MPAVPKWRLKSQLAMEVLKRRKLALTFQLFSNKCGVAKPDGVAAQTEFDKNKSECQNIIGILSSTPLKITVVLGDPVEEKSLGTLALVVR